MSDQSWIAPGSTPGQPASPPPEPAPAAPPQSQWGPPTPPPQSQWGPPTPPPPVDPRAPRPPLPPGASYGTEFRPGIIPLRPLRIGDIYGGVIKMIRGNVGATVGLGFLTCLLFLVPTTAAAALLSRGLTYNPSPDAPFQSGDLLSQLPTIGTLIATILLSGFLAYVVGQAVLGRKVSASETWDGAKSSLPRLIGATLLVGLLMALALGLIVIGPILWLVVAAPEGAGLVAPILLLLLAILLAIAATLWLSTRLAFVTSIIVLEQAGIGTALRRSWALTAGRGFWRLLGIRLLSQFIIGTVTQVIAMPIMMIAIGALVVSNNFEWYYLIQTLLAGFTGLITGALTTPFTAGVDGLLYVDQRIRREGLDVQLIQVAQGQAAPPWPRAAG